MMIDTTAVLLFIYCTQITTVSSKVFGGNRSQGHGHLGRGRQSRYRGPVSGEMRGTRKERACGGTRYGSGENDETSFSSSAGESAGVRTLAVPLLTTHPCFSGECVSRHVLPVATPRTSKDLV